MYSSKSVLTYSQLNTIRKHLVIQRLLSISRSNRNATRNGADKKKPHSGYQHNNTVNSAFATCLYVLKPINSLSRPKELRCDAIFHLSQEKPKQIMVLPTNLSYRPFDITDFLTDEKHIKFSVSCLQPQNPSVTILRGNHSTRGLIDRAHKYESSFSDKKAEYHEPADDPKEKIRLLHEQLKVQVPRYFAKGSSWHDFSIYTPHVDLVITPKQYKNPIIYRGLNPYRRIAWTFRYVNKVWIKNPALDVISSMCHAEKKTIEVRWRVSGIPYYLYILSWLFPTPRSTFIRYYDYMSVIFVNDQGKIWRHDISKVRQVPRSLASYLNSLRRNFTAAAAVTSYVQKPAPSNT